MGDGGGAYERKWTDTTAWDKIRLETNIPEHKYSNEGCPFQSNSHGELYAQPNNSTAALKTLHLEFPLENME